MLRRNIKFIYNVTTTSTYREFLPRDAMHSADYAVAKCLSVRLTVTRRYYIETAKHVTKLFSPPGSHTILVFPYQPVWQYCGGDPNTEAPNAGDMEKSRFSANMSLYLGNNAR